MKALFAVWLICAGFAQAFDPVGPPPERTVEWAGRQITSIRVPRFSFEGTATVGEAIAFLNRTEIPKAYRVEIDGSALGPEALKRRISLKAEDLTLAEAIFRVAHVISADIRVGAGTVSFVPRTK